MVSLFLLKSCLERVKGPIIIIIIIINLKQHTTIGAAGCKLLLSIIISFVSNPGA